LSAGKFFRRENRWQVGGLFRRKRVDRRWVVKKKNNKIRENSARMSFSKTDVLDNSMRQWNFHYMPTIRHNMYIQHNNSNNNNNNNKIFVVKSPTLVSNIVHIYIYMYIYVPRYVCLMKFDDKQAARVCGLTYCEKKTVYAYVCIGLCESTSFLRLRFYFLLNVSSIVSVTRVNSI